MRSQAMARTYWSSSSTADHTSAGPTRAGPGGAARPAGQDGLQHGAGGPAVLAGVDQHRGQHIARAPGIAAGLAAAHHLGRAGQPFEDIRVVSGPASARSSGPAALRLVVPLGVEHLEQVQSVPDGGSIEARPLPPTLPWVLPAGLHRKKSHPTLRDRLRGASPCTSPPSPAPSKQKPSADGSGRRPARTHGPVQQTLGQLHREHGHHPLAGPALGPVAGRGTPLGASCRGRCHSGGTRGPGGGVWRGRNACLAPLQASPAYWRLSTMTQSRSTWTW